MPVAASAQRPSIVANAEGVAISLPATVLGDATVKRQLESGLTTVFVASAKARDARGAGRIEIRFDLWGEQWIVRRIEFDGRSDQQRLASRDALEKWWRAPLRLFAAGAPRSTLDVELTVLPFSAKEEAEARSWMSRSSAVGTAASPAGGLVDALIGTTITARPITRFRWRVEPSSR